MPNTLHLGLIGIGKHGSRYANHIRDDFPDLKLAAVARRDRAKAQAAGEEYGCRAYTDFRELLAADLDAVIIVVPPSLHLEIITAAAQAGRAILLEKPAATGLDVGRKILHVVREQRVPIMVAQTLRYNAVVRAFLAERENIGPLHAIGLSQGFEPSRLAWLDDPATSGGGIILHTGVHSFDLLRILGGEPERVSCQMTSIYTERTEDTFAASIGLRGNQAMAAVNGSRAIGGRTGHIEIAGEKATLVGNHVTNQAYRVVGNKSEVIAVGEPIATVREVLRDFSAALRADAPMPIPFAEGLRAVAIAEACYRAARSGRTVEVEAVEEVEESKSRKVESNGSR